MAGVVGVLGRSHTTAGAAAGAAGAEGEGEGEAGSTEAEVGAVGAVVGVGEAGVGDSIHTLTVEKSNWCHEGSIDVIFRGVIDAQLTMHR